ncbi:MAG: cation-translocating P-type ATPase [Patescibacteria group bacterium]|nr:cation-translocating P-type ATPase [Patescibacteria group bacterium]MDE1945852.1 cation-translocating P-type ATPase [Patescibacteria group bacterium]
MKKQASERLVTFDTVLFVLLVIALPANYFWRVSFKEYFLIGISIVATVPVVISGVKSVLARKLSVDLLAAIALVFSLLARQWVSAVFINLMLTSARMLLSYNEARARHSIDSLMKLKPRKVRVKRADGSVAAVDPKSVKIGDIVAVGLGERVPIDGSVVSGSASVDESSLTGESLPVTKTVGSPVYSSTLVAAGNILVKTEKVGAETTLEKIIKLVEEAELDKPDIHTTAESFATWYIVVIFIGSIAAYVFSHDVNYVLAILLVVCADDIAVAVPLAFLTAISYAAKNGVIIKGASFLEALRDVKVIFVDKTGTITKGKLAVESFVCAETCDAEKEKKILGYAAALAALSNHPIAKAIAGSVTSGEKHAAPDHFLEVSGKGMSAVFPEGKCILGRETYLAESGIAIGAALQKSMRAEEDKGFNTTVVSLGSEALGFFAVADLIKPDIKASVEELKRIGIREVVMLTGDNERVAARIAERAGLTGYHANLLPDDKLAFIKRSLSTEYKTAMVGDGVNDAAALSLADIGIAMGAIGYDAAIESADVVLMKDDFAKIPNIIRLSQYVMRIAGQDFAIWGATNVVGLAFVLTSVLRPTGAAAYNFLTDFLPLFNSIRIFSLYRQKRVESRRRIAEASRAEK